MSHSSARQILEDVAAGRLSPAEGARLLGESHGDATGSDEPQPDAPPQQPPAPAVPEVLRVQVRGTSRRVRLIGDPTVAAVAVDGPHHVRRDGSTLFVSGETEPLPSDDAFVLVTGGRWREAAERVQRGVGQNLELTVRIRPDLAVGVEVIAGSVHSEGLPGLDHVRVTAGSLRVRDAQKPLDVLVQAGSAQIEARPTYGHSRLRCESGSLHLKLLQGSDARVRADVQLGRFAVEPERGRSREVVVGSGAADVDVEAVMGSVTVVTPQ